MNLTIGKGRTVHNDRARLADGTRVPTCSVSVDGKTLTETDAAVTCKTCLKRMPRETAPAELAPVNPAACMNYPDADHSRCPSSVECFVPAFPAVELAPAFSHNPAACSVKGCQLGATA